MARRAIGRWWTSAGLRAAAVLAAVPAALGAHACGGTSRSTDPLPDQAGPGPDRRARGDTSLPAAGDPAAGDAGLGQARTAADRSPQDAT
ncbi:MAG TPA: hypothetical protein VFU21_02440, partial [Kofleriaceae bacterium]|nr:hypothetical protein [Kofleriaceae bacterium]